MHSHAGIHLQQFAIGFEQTFLAADPFSDLYTFKQVLFCLWVILCSLIDLE